MIPYCLIVPKKILSSIFATLAKELHGKYGFSITEIAKLFDMTPVAIEYYLKGKRGAKIKLDECETEMVKAVARSIAKAPSKEIVEYGVCEICKEIRKRLKTKHKCEKD